MAEYRDQIKFIIQRYDNYINGVNTKGNFLLVFNTFVAGAIATNYGNILTKLDTHGAIIGFKIILALFFAAVLYTVIMIFKAVYPFLKSGNSSIEGYHSLIFFNSVAEFSDDGKFKNKFDNQTDVEMQNDLVLQSYQLAKGLKHKFSLIEKAMKAIYVEIGLLIIMPIYLLIF
jgi:hypothetical protein